MKNHQSIKPLILSTLLIIVTFLCNSLRAQVDDGYIYYDGQYSPYEYYSSFPSKRETLDSMLYYHFYKNDSISLYPNTPIWRRYYHRSADGLRDTVYIYYKIHIETYILQYSFDGKLLGSILIDTIQNKPTYFETSYTYDSAGRVIKRQVTGKYSTPDQHVTVMYDYEKGSTTRLDTINGYPREQILYIQPRDYGYMCYEKSVGQKPDGSTYEIPLDSIRIHFDSQKRMLKWQNLFTWETRNYTYFENGYAYELFDKTRKEIYYLDQKGRMVKNENYLRMPTETEYWLYEKSIYQYYPSTEVPGGVAPVEAPKLQAYGVQGGVVVEAHAASNVQVYNLMGRLISQQSVGLARTEITLPRGIYIVTVGGQSQKVVVR